MIRLAGAKAESRLELASGSGSFGCKEQRNLTLNSRVLLREQCRKTQQKEGIGILRVLGPLFNKRLLSTTGYLAVV